MSAPILPYVCVCVTNISLTHTHTYTQTRTCDQQKVYIDELEENLRSVSRECETMKARYEKQLDELQRMCSEVNAETQTLTDVYEKTGRDVVLLKKVLLMWFSCGWRSCVCVYVCWYVGVSV